MMIFNCMNTPFGIATIQIHHQHRCTFFRCFRSLSRAANGFGIFRFIQFCALDNMLTTRHMHLYPSSNASILNHQEQHENLKNVIPFIPFCNKSSHRFTVVVFSLLFFAQTFEFAYATDNVGMLKNVSRFFDRHKKRSILIPTTNDILRQILVGVIAQETHFIHKITITTIKSPND